MDDVQRPPAIEVTLEEGRQGHGEDGLYPMGDEKIDVTTEGQTGGDVGTPDDDEALDWIKNRLIRLIGAERSTVPDRRTAGRLLRRIAERGLEGDWTTAERYFLWRITQGGVTDQTTTKAFSTAARASTIIAELTMKKLTARDPGT